MKKTYILLIIILSVLCGCKNPDKQVYSELHKQKKFKITGSISNGNGKKLYLQEIRPNIVEIKDSVVIDKNGDFAISSSINYPGLYLLRAESGPSIVLCVKGDEKFELKADYNNLIYYSISGNEESEQIQLLAQKTRESLSQISQLSKVSKDSIDSPDYASIKTRINTDFAIIVDDLRDFSRNFIKNNQTSLITLLALKNEIGPNMHVLHPVNDKELFQFVDSVLISRYPKSELVLSLNSELKTYLAQIEADKVSPGGFSSGETVPEIALPSPNGEIIKLSSLKGKIVLLDFWAAWCPPCRTENPNLVENYRKYHSKGFEIYQVSLDRERADWLKAIKDDKLNWLHVSDLKYWNSEVVSVYGIKGIPTNYLLNKEGEIIASNLRGSALSEKLEEIFN